MMIKLNEMENFAWQEIFKMAIDEKNYEQFLKAKEKLRILASVRNVPKFLMSIAHDGKKYIAKLEDEAGYTFEEIDGRDLTDLFWNIDSRIELICDFNNPETDHKVGIVFKFTSPTYRDVIEVLPLKQK
jgi:hypothetical protein